jgi:hypothetical protein
MSGYAASARLQRGVPRFKGTVASGVTAAGVVTPPAAPTGAFETAGANDGWVELVGRPLEERLAARWSDLREAWTQTTFFLFDPESWR